jgi:hypothetical protein
MGIFQKHPNQQQQQPHESTYEEDAATIPKLSDWKKARKQEKKARAEAFASKKARRSRKIDALVYHSEANRGRHRQNEYCSSPVVVAAHQQALQEASSIGWSTVKIAAKGLFGGLGK